MKYLLIAMTIVIFSGCANNVKKTTVEVDPLASVAPVKKCKVYVKADGFSNPFSLKCKPKNTQLYKVKTRKR